MRAKDVAIAAISTSIFAMTMIIVSPLVIVPGAIIFYIPAAWQLLWPIWFGIPGCFGIFIGNLIGCYFKGVYGISALIEALGNSLSGLIPYFTIPSKAANPKTKKDVLILFLTFLPGKAIGTLITVSGYLLFMPWQTAFLYVYPAYMTFDLIWQFTVGLLLLKTITPILRQIGVYYGVYAERKR